MTAHFVTGKSGTIGRHLSKKSIEISIDLKQEFYISDSEYSLEGANVTHLAGIVGESEVQKDPRAARRINFDGTLRLAERLLERQISRFTFISTSHVYAKSDMDITEDWTLSPRGEYAHQKLDTEQELTGLFKSSKCELTILRVFSILDWDVKDFTLGGAIRKAINGEDQVFIQNGDDVRDFLTPKTVANVIENLAEIPGMPGVWNVCSGRGVSVREAGLTMLKGATNKRFEDIFLRGNSEIPRIVGCNRKLMKKIPLNSLKWEPSKMILRKEDQNF